MKKSAPPVKVSTLSNNRNYSPFFGKNHRKFNDLNNYNYDNYVLLNVILLINIILSIASLEIMVGLI